MTESIEHQFHATGNTQLIENTEEIFLNCMFAEAEFLSNFAITQSIGDQGNNLFFARSKQFEPARIHYAE